VIAEATDALAIAHEAGLARLCLTPACLWCGTGGEVTIGLRIVSALSGAHAAANAPLGDRPPWPLSPRPELSPVQ
jgi:hypothetical protein